MNAMKKKDLDKFKELLLEEKRKLLRHLEDLSESSGEEVELATGDPADIASQEISHAALQKIGGRETRLLKKIEKALKKIEDKTFGECEICGEEIAAARLMARPVAELCIDCKTQQENEERRYSKSAPGEEEGEVIGEEESAEEG